MTTAFSLSLPAGTSQAAVKDCISDYIIIEDGFDPAVAAGPTNVWDRFCGERLNVAAGNAALATVCSTAKPFAIVIRTDGDEPDAEANTAGNLGFCLSFAQRSV